MYHNGERLRLLPNLNVLAAITKGMWAVELCTNKNPPVHNWECQLTQVDLYSGCKTVNHNNHFTALCPGLPG